MSEADPTSMEVTGEGAAMNKDNIPAMKEVAKEVMESISSEVNGKSSEQNMNGENGAVERSENGTKEVLEEEEASPEEQDGDEEAEEMANQNGDMNSHEGEEEDGNSDTNGGESTKSGEEETDGKGDKSEEQNEEGGPNESEKDEISAPSSPTKSPKKKKEKEPIKEEDIRRSGRKKTPTKYHELLINELALEAMEDASEEEIEDVEEVKDDDSDIQEVEQEDPLNHSVSITPKNSGGEKKPNVVTIDDLKTLQRLATSAKQSMDKAKSDNLMVIDTQSIIAGKAEVINGGSDRKGDSYSEEHQGQPKYPEIRTYKIRFRVRS